MVLNWDDITIFHCITNELRSLPFSWRYRRLSFLLCFLCVLFLYTLFSLSNLTSSTILLIPMEHSFQYCILYNFSQSSKNFRVDSLEPVVLAVHTSLNMAHNIFDQVSTWDGPISLSLYLERDVEDILTVMHSITQCDREIREKMSIHIVTERSLIHSKCLPIYYTESTDCTLYSREKVRDLLLSISRPSLIYPINLMRNVARRGSAYSLQIVTDVEMLFSHSFYSNVLPIANEIIGKKKAVLVFRRFETEEGEIIPKTVQKLEESIGMNRTIPFHGHFFSEGHFIPGLDKWIAKSINNPKITVDEVEYGTKKWEPQFIMHSTDPFHDEGVPTRHRDHQVLCYELCRARYQFLVLSHVFNVHRGIKTKLTFRNLAVHELGIGIERRIDKTFSKRMNILYPSTKGKCKPYVELRESLYEKIGYEVGGITL